ncbi:uncharacterized protein PAC_14385 [Phialocephala subalpina]|uniref:F-box domain-containing protein n=1 Tax=Phialocephala subalpina TaxID=576137 RepID=A0A1L7XHQ8_9HELO|nr:uncharacterized protein PAC_14385 [Phialocephala subalpina]
MENFNNDRAKDMELGPEIKKKAEGEENQAAEAPGTISSGSVEEAEIEGNADETHHPRADQNSILAKLPTELHLQIFDNLQPAARRLLGATCKPLYKVWKKYHYEKGIRIHIDEYRAAHKDDTSTAHKSILMHWTEELGHKNKMKSDLFTFDLWSAELCNRLGMKKARKNTRDPTLKEWKCGRIFMQLFCGTSASVLFFNHSVAMGKPKHKIGKMKPRKAGGRRSRKPEKNSKNAGMKWETREGDMRTGGEREAPAEVKLESKNTSQIQRASQCGRLPKLPTELLLQIFQYYGPAARRIMGATCKAFYDVFTEYYLTQLVRVHMDEYLAIHDGGVSLAYKYILLDWVQPTLPALSSATQFWYFQALMSHRKATGKPATLKVYKHGKIMLEYLEEQKSS